MTKKRFKKQQKWLSNTEKLQASKVKPAFLLARSLSTTAIATSRHDVLNRRDSKGKAADPKMCGRCVKEGMFIPKKKKPVVAMVAADLASLGDASLTGSEPAAAATVASLPGASAGQTPSAPTATSVDGQ